MRARLVFAVLVAMMACCACQNTTGDPRAGGLFGWSEDKAKQRQADLQSQAASATQTATAEQASRARLEEEKRVADAETRTLELRLNALVEENRRLESQLAELRKRNTASSDKLQAMLRELDAMRSSTPVPTAGASTAQRRAQAEQLDQRNAKLHQAIQLMLQR